MDLKALKVKLFCDSGNLADMEEMVRRGGISGFTTNPSLVRRAGVADYLAFCRDAARLCGDLPLSLEVIADTPDEIRRQARILAALGPNVWVKVPVVDSHGASNVLTIESLVHDGVPLNVTACFTKHHVRQAIRALQVTSAHHCVSVFAGRIADAGLDPVPTMRTAAIDCHGTNIQVIWASVREPLNIIQAAQCGVDAITVFPEMLRKIHLFGRDLDQFAAETSKMFFEDAKTAGYTL